MAAEALECTGQTGISCHGAGVLALLPAALLCFFISTSLILALPHLPISLGTLQVLPGMLQTSEKSSKTSPAA